MDRPQIPFRQHIDGIISYIFNGTIQPNDNDTKYVSLLKTMSSVTRFAFDQDFCDFGSELVPDFFEKQNNNPAFKESDKIWRAYLDNFFNNNGLQGVLEQYPLIGLLAHKAWEQILNFDAELHQRIEKDKELLAQVFNHNQPLGNIISISSNEGDFHQKGRSTAILQFSCGLKIVYKPRYGTLDAAFNVLLHQIAVETGIELRSFKVTDRGEYSWVEFIKHKPVTSGDELPEYYKRCGALMAICYLLNGTDFHYENIIAHGAYPVLIDLECLFGATDEMKRGAYSVYYTGLMPMYLYEGDEKAPTDHSGLGATGETILGTEVWKWKDTGTDATRLVKEAGSFIAKGNQPVYNGKIVSPEKYPEQIIEGFERTCNWFIRQKSLLEEPGCVLAQFKNKPFRVVIRYTRNYKFAMDNSCICDALASAKDREHEIYESLNEFPTILHLKNNIRRSVLKHEAAAIREMNIPLFTGNTSEKGIYESGDFVCDNFFKTEPYQFVINKIRRFNKADLDQQVNLIRSAFIVRYGIDTGKGEKRFNNKAAFDNAVVTKEAKKIASLLVKSGIKTADGYTWNSFIPNRANQLAYNTISSGFYDGTIGIAYYLFVLGKSTGAKTYTTIIKVIINNEVSKCLSPGYEMDISYANGIAGLIFVLTKINSQESLDTALKLAQLIEEKHIVADTSLDIMKGSAGLILSLSSLYEGTRSAEVLALLNIAGDHLLNNSITDERSGLCGWNSDHFKKPLTGFSHGSSGIAFALLKLYQLTGAVKYKDAFYKALEFEDFYRTPDASNWQDLRKSNAAPKAAWCHGAAGIGLARLHAYNILQGAELLPDIETAIGSTIAALSIEDGDFYCCGNMGRIDFLIEAARILNRPELIKTVQAFIMDIIHKKYKNGYYHTYDIPNVSLEHPSIFRGISGIGYVLLRSMEDSDIPCLGLAG